MTAQRRTFSIARVSLAALLLVVYGASTKADDALRQRFLAEYPSAVARVEQFYSRMRLRARETMARQDPTAPDFEWEHEYKVSGNLYALETKFIKYPDGSKHPDSSAKIANPRSSFAVRRGGPETDWTLTGAIEYLPAKRSMPFDVYGVGAPTHFLEAQVLDVIREPGFQITDASSLEREGKRLLRIDFTRQLEQSQADGWFLFSPAESWILYGYAQRSTDGKSPPEVIGTLRAEISYRESGESLPWLTRAEHWSELSRWNNGKYDVTKYGFYTFEVLDLQRSEIPPAEFTLAAYGIPEPAETPNTQRWWIIIGIVSAVFVASFCVFWLSRRRASTSSESRT